jgi:hypothetical protein
MSDPATWAERLEGDREDWHPRDGDHDESEDES